MYDLIGMDLDQFIEFTWFIVKVILTFGFWFILFIIALGIIGIVFKSMAKILD